MAEFEAGGMRFEQWLKSIGRSRVTGWFELDPARLAEFGSSVLTEPQSRVYPVNIEAPTQAQGFLLAAAAGSEHAKIIGELFAAYDLLFRCLDEAVHFLGGQQAHFFRVFGQLFPLGDGVGPDLLEFQRLVHDVTQGNDIQVNGSAADLFPAGEARRAAFLFQSQVALLPLLFESLHFGDGPWHSLGAMKWNFGGWLTGQRSHLGIVGAVAHPESTHTAVAGIEYLLEAVYFVFHRVVSELLLSEVEHGSTRDLQNLRNCFVFNG